MRLRTSGRRRCGGVVMAVLASAVLSVSLAAQGKGKTDQAQRADAQALVDMVEAASQGTAPSGGGLDLDWGRHYFLKAQGDRTYVPFVLQVPAGVTSSPAVGLYLRVVARGAPPAAAEPKEEEKTDAGKTGTDGETAEYAFEDLYFFDLPAAAPGRPHRIARAFAVAPGEYDVYVAIKERAAGKSDEPAKSGVVHEALTVPNFHVEGLTTSDVIFAERVETLAQPIDTETQADHPFTFGQMQVQPAVEHRFTKKDALQFVFWIYGAATDPQTKKPDVNVEYKFHRVEGEKQTYFNRTEPQVLNAQTLPPEFDAAAGHQLAGSLADVPLVSFPEGDYRLEIEVQDKAAGKQITRDVNFTVAP